MDLSQGFGSESRVAELARLVNHDHSMILQLAWISIALSIVIVGLAVMLWHLRSRVTRLELVGPSLSDRISREPTGVPQAERQ